MTSMFACLVAYLVSTIIDQSQIPFQRYISFTQHAVAQLPIGCVAGAGAVTVMTCIMPFEVVMRRLQASPHPFWPVLPKLRASVLSLWHGVALLDPASMTPASQSNKGALTHQSPVQSIGNVKCRSCAY